MPYAFVCDFDGTVAPDDIGAQFVHAFGRGPDDALRQALDDWRRGAIGHRELTQVECARMEVTEPEARAFASRFRLDAEFAPFARAAAAQGHGVVVASEGFDFYVADLLLREGLGDVPFTANRLRFVEGRVVPEFAPDGCGRCGNCKGARVAGLRDRGFEVVMVGDGLSDRCGARAADHVHARDGLLEWCRREGIGALPFRGFADLASWAGAGTRRAGGER